MSNQDKTLIVKVTLHPNAVPSELIKCIETVLGAKAAVLSKDDVFAECDALRRALQAADVMRNCAQEIPLSVKQLYDDARDQAEHSQVAGPGTTTEGNPPKVAQSIVEGTQVRLRIHAAGIKPGSIGIVRSIPATYMADVTFTTANDRPIRLLVSHDAIEPVARPKADDKDRSLARLRAALAAMVPVAEQHLNDLGGCDHSVGICLCDDRRAIEQAKATLEAVD